MIERLESGLPTFKALVFEPGFNVVLAERSAGATDRQTRNGSGKSSLVERVHFLLGGSYPADHLLRAPQLVDAWYGMRFDLAGWRTEIRRTPAHAKDIEIVAGETAAWPRAPRADKLSRRSVLSNTDWRSVLGRLMFGLVAADDDGADGEDGGGRRFGPSFRTQVSYFARRQNAGGFQHPQQGPADGRDGGRRAVRPALRVTGAMRGSGAGSGPVLLGWAERRSERRKERI